MKELLRDIGMMCMAVGLVAGVARAEGVGSSPPGASNDRRIYSTTTVLPTAGGLVSIGGQALRRLTPGSRRWETLHSIPKDSLYRVAADDSGRLLAAWENDSNIYLFSAGGKQVASFPKPPSPPEVSPRYQVSTLEFLPNGRDALVYMSGKVKVKTRGYSGEGWSTAAYRIALDGKSEAEQLFRLDQGYRLHASRFGAVFAMPRGPGSCDHGGCDIASIVAYELIADGVRQKTLIDSNQADMDRARVVRGGNAERVAVLLKLERPGGLGLLSWRYGDAKADFRTVPSPVREDDAEFLWTRSGEFIELRAGEEFLEVWRYSPRGEEKLARLPALRDVDTDVHGIGERADGTLWLQWGDHLGLLSPGKPPRSYDLEPLLPRRSEWTGNIYVKSPEHLWIGIDGKGRHFVRVDLADVEKRSQVWR
jgi:hypothetical protein